MVLRGITYEAPSYLLLPPFSARPPFYSPCLCSAHPSILSSSSYIDSLLLNFHPLYALFFSPHLSPADLLFLPLCSCPHPSSSLPSLSLSLSVYCTPTSLLLLIHFPDLLTPLAPFHCLTLSAPLTPKRHSHCLYVESRTI